MEAKNAAWPEYEIQIGIAKIGKLEYLINSIEIIPDTSQTRATIKLDGIVIHPKPSPAKKIVNEIMDRLHLILEEIDK